MLWRASAILRLWEVPKTKHNSLSARRCCPLDGDVEFDLDWWTLVVAVFHQDDNGVLGASDMYRDVELA